MGKWVLPDPLRLTNLNRRSHNELDSPSGKRLLTFNTVIKLLISLSILSPTPGYYLEINNYSFSPKEQTTNYQNYNLGQSNPNLEALEH